MLLQMLDELANELLAEGIGPFFLRNVDVLILDKIRPGFRMSLYPSDRQVFMGEGFNLANITTGDDFSILRQGRHGLGMGNYEAP